MIICKHQLPSFTMVIIIQTFVKHFTKCSANCSYPKNMLLHCCSRVYSETMWKISTGMAPLCFFFCLFVFFFSCRSVLLSFYYLKKLFAIKNSQISPSVLSIMKLFLYIWWGQIVIITTAACFCLSKSLELAQYV